MKQTQTSYNRKVVRIEKVILSWIVWKWVADRVPQLQPPNILLDVLLTIPQAQLSKQGREHWHTIPLGFHSDHTNWFEVPKFLKDPAGAPGAFKFLFSLLYAGEVPPAFLDLCDLAPLKVSYLTIVPGLRFTCYFLVIGFRAKLYTHLRRRVFLFFGPILSGSPWFKPVLSVPLLTKGCWLGLFTIKQRFSHFD